MTPAPECQNEIFTDEKHNACSKYQWRLTARQRAPRKRGEAPRDRAPAALPKATDVWRANSASSCAAWFKRQSVSV